MKYTVVLPSIYQPWTNKCLKDCKLKDVLVVDNTETNIGVAASWNKGIDKLRQDKADWLVILSAAIRFGEAGGLDFINYLDTLDQHIAVEAGMGLGWHLIAFSKETIEKAGRFDENFYPAYYEDLDYAWRVKQAFGGLEPPYWAKFTIDAGIAGWGHGVELGGADRVDNKDYMLRKWGDLTGADLYEHPFNDPNNSIKYWPEFRGAKWDA